MGGVGLLRRRDAAARLDPVRWRRPGRATVLRSATVALLVAVAAAIAWSGPSPCAPVAATTAAQFPTSSDAGARSGPSEARPGSDPSEARPGPGPADARPGSGPSDARPASGPSEATPRSGPTDPRPGPGSSETWLGSGLSGDGAGPAPAHPGPTPAAAGAGGDRRAVPAGRLGVPLRLSDPATLTLVAPGDRVTVLRVDDSGRTAEVASAALVLGVTDAGDLATAGLLVALTPAEAERAVADQGRGFAVLLRPG